MREPDDDFVDRLAALDEALADGHTPSELAGESLPDELQARLHRGLAALQKLRYVRSETDVPTVHDRDSPTWGSERTGQVPMHFGRFHIIRELGRGGFGIVFLARDPKLHREVALKVPHAQAVMDSAMRERFRREAKVAAALDHPNIVAVYEVDEQGPICALVSAYCPAITLSEWLARQKAPVDAQIAAQMVASLADAVAHAHSKGILHRDLKPANVLVNTGPMCGDFEDRKAGSPPPAALNVKITDFGLASYVDETNRMTRSGAILGTPEYMAPEQARGRHDSVDARADIYALGGILYALLTGGPPFRGESDVDTLKLVCEQDPIAPRQLRPKLPRDLETICLKCLEKEPHRRYASAEDLRDDLRRFLTDVPVLARPISRATRAWRWCRRHPAVSGLSLALALAVVLGTAGIAVAFANVQIERNSAINQRNVATAERDRNGRLLDNARGSIAELIDRGHQLVHQPGTVREGLDMLEVGRRYYTTLLNETPGDVKLRQQAMLICRRLGMVYNERQDPASTLAWQEAVKHGETLLDRSDGEQFRCEYLDLIHNWAEILFVNDQYDAVFSSTERALAVARQMCKEQPDDPKAAWNLHGVLLFRGLAARKANKSADAESVLGEGLALLRKFGDAVGVPQSQLAQSNYLNQLSLAAVNQNQLSKAIDFGRESVELIRKTHESMPNDPAVFRALGGALYHYGRAHYNSKHWQEAVDLLREANKIFIENWAFNIHQPHTYLCVAIGTKGIASSLGFLDRKDEAIPDLQAMIALPPPMFRPGRNDPVPPDLIECYARLAAIYVLRGENELAKQTYDEAMKKLEAVANKTEAYATPERWLAGVAEKLAAKPKE